MVKVYYDNDADIKYIKGKTIAILGYGSQGHAHALNLRESGLNVIVAQRKGSKNYDLAVKDGFSPVSIEEAAKKADILMLTLPDQVQAKIYNSYIKDNLKPGSYIAFAHGFNIHFGQIVAPENVGVFMVAPKSPGHLVRRTYTEGHGVPCLLAIEKDPSGDTKKVGLAYAG